MKDLKRKLAIPMYGLHYIDSVQDVNYTDNHILLFKRDYSLVERREIFDSLEWAMSNKDTDFKNIRPYSSDRFSNSEIFEYLKKLYLFMKESNLNTSE